MVITHLNIVDIIIFADETAVSLWNGVSFHPIIMTLGNLPIKVQATDNAKITIGYIPILKCIVVHWSQGYSV